MIRRRPEDELVVGPANCYADSGAWADGPDDPEPVFEVYATDEHFVVCAIDEPRQWMAAKHPAEIEQ